MYVLRMMNDYDPKTGLFWRAPQGDIPDIFYQEGKLTEQNRELYNLVYDSLPSHLTSAVNEPITTPRVPIRDTLRVPIRGTPKVHHRVDTRVINLRVLHQANLRGLWEGPLGHLILKCFSISLPVSADDAVAVLPCAALF